MALLPIPVLHPREPFSAEGMYRLREGLRHTVSPGRVH
jgi:hypothetical protein